MSQFCSNHDKHHHHALQWLPRLTEVDKRQWQVCLLLRSLIFCLLERLQLQSWGILGCAAVILMSFMWMFGKDCNYPELSQWSVWVYKTDSSACVLPKWISLNREGTLKESNGSSWSQHTWCPVQLPILFSKQAQLTCLDYTNNQGTSTGKRRKENTQCLV